MTSIYNLFIHLKTFAEQNFGYLLIYFPTLFAEPQRTNISEKNLGKWNEQIKITTHHKQKTYGTQSKVRNKKK